MSYSPASDPDSSKWNLSGTWKVDGESITAVSGDATLTYRFDGREMYLVMGGTEGATVKVEVNGRIQHPGQDVADGTAIIHQHRLYRLVSLPKAAEGTLVTLHFSPGVTANAFTFGG